MPELPEVETIARCLAADLAGRLFKGRPYLDPRIVAGGRRSSGKIPRALAGRRIIGLRREGKVLILVLDPPGALVFRLGMTGSLRLATARGKPDLTHLHAMFPLSGGRVLLYTDPRRFGRILVDSGSPYPRLGLAPDPLSPAFTWRILAERGSRSRRAVKALLMDQKVVSGIGNIYACEILHRGRIHPARRADRLAAEEWKSLSRISRLVLTQAVEAGGSSIADFVSPGGEKGRYQAAHRVYGREGGKCPRCRGTVLRVLQGGRSTYFCGLCQK